MYPASVEYLNRQRIIPNWGGGLWEQRYIFFFHFFSFCECVCVCFCVWFCLYSFAFTICPRVLSVRCFSFFFCIVFSACYHWWICFLVWLLSSFFLSFSFFNYFFKKIFNNYFLLFIVVTLFYLLLSFFSPFYSEPCGWQALGAPARCQGRASETGEPSSGHWSTRHLPAPHIIKWQNSPRDLHLNAKTQLHSTTSELQGWTPYTKQLARQEHNPTH